MIEYNTSLAGYCTVDVSAGATLHLPIVGAMERFVFMKASTSASVTLFLR